MIFAGDFRVGGISSVPKSEELVDIINIKIKVVLNVENNIDVLTHIADGSISQILKNGELVLLIFMN